jgi:hypothetical protein
VRSQRINLALEWINVEAPAAVKNQDRASGTGVAKEDTNR